MAQDFPDRSANNPLVVTTSVPAVLPPLVANASSAARFAYETFFGAVIRNPHTRKNYRHAVHQFLSWCELRELALRQVAPKDVGEYLDALPYALPTKNVHLSALRHFFDEMVLRHVVVLNPAHSVRGDRYEVIEGKTPEISVADARRLLRGIDTSSVVGLRDKSVIAILAYTAARIGAVAKLRRGDFHDDGEQYCLRFAEKGGKAREIPVRHDLCVYLREYLVKSQLVEAEPGAPFFRTAVGRTKRLSENPMTANDMGRMVKRRMKDAKLSERLSPHSFRATIITDLLRQGVPLEDVQRLAGHKDPRTTRLYDRRKKKVTRNIVERISI